MGYLKTLRQFARVMLNTPAHRAIDRGGNEIRTRTDIRMTLSNRRQLQEATHDDALSRAIAAAYYDDAITFERLKALVGAEEAANRVLKRQLEEDFLDGVADA